MIAVWEWLDAAKKLVDPLDAELILAHAMSFGDRSLLITMSDELMSPKELRHANKYLEERRNGKPIAYICNEKEFYGYNFTVTPATLIPRPESEAIIRLALGLRIPPHKILDVGTGCGCLALTLLAKLLPKNPQLRILCTDISKRAISCAILNSVFSINRIGFSSTSYVDFQVSDLLNKVEDADSFDLIVANLPYVDKDWDFIDKEALSYEPNRALYADDHGLACIKRLILQLEDLPSPRHLILEADPCQHDAVIAFAEAHGAKFVKKDDFALLFKY